MQKLILAVSTVSVALGMMVLATPGNARSQAWCSRMQGALHCMYATEEQCRASVSGRGGTCVPRHSNAK
jgi:hypothetical protein